MIPTREAFLRHCSDTLSALKREGRYREFAHLEKQADRFPIYRWHGEKGARDVVVWSSNDYLGMGSHPVVLEAAESALRSYGAGAGGTRNISGTSPLHDALETELAALHAKQAALLFGSGYISNQAVAQARLLAPADGVVIRRSVQLGAVSAEGQEMFRLVRDGRLELDAKVPELDLVAVRPGQAARVVHGSWEVQATVRAIAPLIATDTRLGVVHIALPADSPLRPGMFARAEIRLDTAPNLVVPQTAIVFRDDGPAVFVQNVDNSASLRRLNTGARSNGLVEVLGGLQTGELVVTSGAGFLSDGDRVRVVPPLAGAAH